MRESIYEQYGRKYKFSKSNKRKLEIIHPTREYAQPGFLGTNAGTLDWWHEIGYHQRAHVIAFEKDNYIVKVCTKEKDGYYGVLVGYKEIPPTECARSKLELYESVGIPPVKWMRQFRVAHAKDIEGFEPGQRLEPWNMFKDGDLVDVGGLSRGRGWQGVITRWKNRRGPMSHGSRYHRRPGSMGCAQTPAKIRPGKKMPGDMGMNFTLQKQVQVLKVDPEERVVIVNGALPGEFGSVVQISPYSAKGINFFPMKEGKIPKPWWAKNILHGEPLEF